MKIRCVCLFLVSVCLLSSCSKIFYGSKSDIDLLTENDGDVVDLFAIGPKDTVVYRSITLPYTLRVKHNNLPLRVSVKSDNYYYDNFTISAKEKGRLGAFMSGLWGGCLAFVGFSTIGGAIPLAACLTMGTVGAGMAGLSPTMITRVPEEKSILLTSEEYNVTNLYKKSDWWLQMNEVNDIYTLLDDYERELAESKVRYLIDKEPTAELYYISGIVKSKRYKYKDAIKDLKSSYNMVENNPGLKKQIASYIDYVNDKMDAEKAERKKERQEVWGDFAVNALQVAAQTYNQMAQYNNWQQSGITPSGVVTDPTKLSQTQLNNLANPMFAAQQVNQAYWQRYTEFCRYNKKPDGSNYTYQEWCAIEGQMIQNAKEQGYDIIEENRQMLAQQKADFNEQRKKDKEDWFARYGYDISSSSSNSANVTSAQSTSTVSTTVKTTNSNNYSSEKSIENKTTTTEAQKIDSKQQFKREGVSSDDYHYKKKVTLYKRNGKNASAMFTDKDLCVKNANYYVKINNMYYKVIYSNWNKFNRQIVYGHEALYFNM